MALWQALKLEGGALAEWLVLHNKEKYVLMQPP